MALGVRQMYEEYIYLISDFRMAESTNTLLNQNDNQSIIAFRNLKNAKLFALDIGGSLTKIAYYSTRINQRLLHRPDSNIR